MKTPIQKVREALAVAFMLRDRAIQRGDEIGLAHLDKQIDKLGNDLEMLRDRRAEFRRDAEEDADTGGDEE